MYRPKMGFWHPPLIQKSGFDVSEILVPPKKTTIFSANLTHIRKCFHFQPNYFTNEFHSKANKHLWIVFFSWKISLQIFCCKKTNKVGAMRRDAITVVLHKFRDAGKTSACISNRSAMWHHQQDTWLAQPSLRTVAPNTSQRIPGDLSQETFFRTAVANYYSIKNWIDRDSRYRFFPLRHEIRHEMKRNENAPWNFATHSECKDPNRRLKWRSTLPWCL